MKTKYKIRQSMVKLFYWIVKELIGIKVIVDVTGTVLTPGNKGKECKGNGEHVNWRGKVIECCCDECDYMMCCVNEHILNECINCTDKRCPRARNIK